MINNVMTQDTKTAEETTVKPGPKPDEKGSFLLQSHVKITDPESGDVLVNQRG